MDSHASSAPSNSLDGRVYHDGIIAQGNLENGQENDIILAAADYYNNRYNRNATEDQIFTNTYIKLRELSLTYQVPSKLYSKLRLQGLSVSLIGNDLFYIYKNVPNVSPESVLGTKAQLAYVEYTSYPYTRNFGFSLKVKF